MTGSHLPQGVSAPFAIFLLPLSCVQHSEGSCSSYHCECVGLFVLGLATGKSSVVGVIHQARSLPKSNSTMQACGVPGMAKHILNVILEDSPCPVCLITLLTYTRAYYFALDVRA